MSSPDAHARLYVATFTPKQRALWTCLRCGAVVRHMDRPRERSGRLAKTHCGCAAQAWRAMTPDQLHEHKRQVMIGLKRKYRRQKGARLRSDMAASTQAKREAAAIRKSQRESMALQDAHVKRYKNVLYNRRKAAERYAENPQAERERATRRKHELVDSYVIYNLKASGVPVGAITPRLIALKREAMEYRRISLSLKRAIKTNWKENNEAITKYS